MLNYILGVYLLVICAELSIVNEVCYGGYYNNCFYGGLLLIAESRFCDYSLICFEEKEI